MTTQQSFPIILTITEFFSKFLTKGVHGIYWYIYMLIGLYLLTPILQKIFKDISSSLLHYLLLILTLFIIIQNLMSANYTDNILLFNYSFPYLVYIGYYIGGYYIYAYSSKSINFQLITNVCFFTFYLLGILNSIFSFTTFPLYFFQSLFFFGILISKKPEISLTNKQKLITFISKTSYGIYLSHFLFISAICKLGFEKIIPTYIEPILMTSIVLCLEIGLQYCIKYLKLERILQ